MGWYSQCQRRLPILKWAPEYDRTSGIADLIAGITLGLTLVPQSIAYASLANLPVQYGLYSAFMGTMLYMFLGTVKEVSIGPTSLMALLVLQICRGLPIEFVILLTFIAGCVVFIMGLLKLGFLVDLISPSVISAFTSATAITIIVSQLKGFLGLKFVAESIVENVELIWKNWASVRLADCALGVVCCTVLLSLRKIKDIKVNPKKYKLKKSLWLISIARNALVVAVASAVAFCTYDPEMPMFKLSGRVEAGLPKIGPPPFSVVVNNQTLGFMDMVGHIGSGVVVVPVVMVLANTAIAKAFSPGGQVDATQEMLTLGFINVAGSFVHAMPTCGAFTRSAVSHSSGVRTPAAGFYSGIITLLALNFLTQYFFFIPKACLSSVLMCAVVFMIDIKIALDLWRNSKSELVVWALTFSVGVLKNLELSVLAGVCASLAILIRDVVQSPVEITYVKATTGNVVHVSIRRALVFANASRICSRVQATTGRTVVVDCGAITLCDYTASQALSLMIKKFKESDRQIIFYNASSDCMKWLESISELDKRPLKIKSMQDALDAISTKLNEVENETSALLDKKPLGSDENV